MNINLANIDFAPGQGGGGEAVIRSLNVTENGTYSAPSGVDGYSPVSVNVSSGGGSITPEEQAALDTLVNSSDGVLYTEDYVQYRQDNKSLENYSALYNVFWNDIYMISNNYLYKLNRNTYKFDCINHFDNFWAGASFFVDKSGRAYWEGRELDLENGTMAETAITLPDFYNNNGSSNILYGEYGVWILSGYAYKFNESTQEFEQKELVSSFQYGGQSVYLNLFKYEDHILGTYVDRTFEVTEYEDHIEVSDVTGDYFNMGSYTDQFGFRTTSDGDLYYINPYDYHKYDKTSGEWIDVQISNTYYPMNQDSLRVSDNFIFEVYQGNPNYLVWINLGSSYKITSWMSPSEHMVDLTSNQTIKGLKTFNTIYADQYVVKENGSVFSDQRLRLTSNGEIYNVGRKISFANNTGNKTMLKNGTKQIATVDQIFVNSTFVPYGLDGDEIGYVSGSEQRDYNFNTYTNRYFKKYNDVWYEFDGTTTLVPVSFTFNNFSGNNVFSSPSATILKKYDDTGEVRTYLWDDANTNWIDICSASNVGDGSYGLWFDGSNIRYQDTYILVETGGVWSWESDPLANNIWEYNYKFGYKNGEVYAYNDSDWHLYKYDSVQCTMTKIGFTNAGSRLYSYFNEMFFEMNGGNVYVVDLSKVDPNDPEKFVLGDILFSNYNIGFIGATDKLYHYFQGMMYSSYDYIYEFPEVPGSDGMYTLKAVREGDQITYGWELDV